MKERTFNPYSEIFPLMSESELLDLAEDIKNNGLQEPIWIDYVGRILDGRNRYLACKRVGIEPAERIYHGRAEDMLSFVISANLRRRHLNESQRAMVANKIATLTDGQKKAGAQICAATQDEAATLLNVSRRLVQDARKVEDEGAPELAAAVIAGEVAVSTAADLTELPKEEQAEIIARGEKEILAKAKEIRSKKTGCRRAERFEKLKEIQKGNKDLFIQQRFPILYIDPPWEYEFCETDSREIENQYPTMDLEKLKALPVSDLACDAALLFCWATAPKLQEAISCVNAWGFEYRTCFVWVKDKIGMGYWCRSQHELLLVAKRGDFPAPSPENRHSSVVIADRTKHSAKPENFYQLIEAMFPDIPKIELFARSRREGWEAWGNEADA